MPTRFPQITVLPSLKPITHIHLPTPCPSVPLRWRARLMQRERFLKSFLEQGLHQVLTMHLASTPVSSKAFTRNSGSATKGPATEGRESRESGVPRQGRNAQKRGACDECWGPAKTQFCGRGAQSYRAISPKLDERNSVNVPVAAGNHIAN